MFEELHADRVVGRLTMVDRLILKGHLTRFYARGGLAGFVAMMGVEVREFGQFAEAASERLKTRAHRLAEASGRPYLYLDHAHTQGSGQTKEKLAREIAARDGVREGLVCVLSTVEPCRSYVLTRSRSGVPWMRLCPRKCLHLYFYFLDREFGLMHVRLQTWFPFGIQVWVNGREWLARQLDRRGIRYERWENALLQIDDLGAAERLCRRFLRWKWAAWLDRLAWRINPWCQDIAELGFGGYYWVIEECEVATDVMFASRKKLEEILPDLYEHATQRFTCRDVLRFLGRRQANGVITSDYKKRPEGRRVKHRLNRNWIKMYDKRSVLRVETTINNPRDYKVLRVRHTRWGKRRRWMPMNKGVRNLWRYIQVGTQANRRYLDALENVQPKQEAIAELDRLCRHRVVDGRRWPGFQPVRSQDASLFTAVLSGDFFLNGFRNKHLAALLYGDAPQDRAALRRRCTRVCRLIAKLRAFDLIAKVPKARLYRVTALGQRTLTAALKMRTIDFPAALLAAA